MQQQYIKSCKVYIVMNGIHDVYKTPLRLRQHTTGFASTSSAHQVSRCSSWLAYGTQAAVRFPHTHTLFLEEEHNANIEGFLLEAD